MDVMDLRRRLIMAVVTKKNIKIESGSFIAETNTRAITISHTLGKIPKIYYCVVSDDGVSQDTSQRISCYGTMNGVPAACELWRSRNGDKFYSAVVFTTSNYVTPPTATEIVFGGSKGVNTNWAAATYEWTAITWDD